MKFFVTIAEKTMEVTVDGERVEIDGQRVDAELQHVPGSPMVRLVVDGSAVLLAVDQRIDGGWRLIDRGDVRDVDVEDERARHIRLLAGPARGEAARTVLKSPMPGLVVRIPVAAGDQVAAGAPLVVLSAMKMENELKAAGAAVVTAVRVAAGDAVEKGAVLLELGPVP